MTTLDPLVQTYYAVSSQFTPIANPSDIFSISGSDTRVIGIVKIALRVLQPNINMNSGSYIDFKLIKRSTHNVDGLPNIIKAYPFDAEINNPPTALIKQYTKNPTLGKFDGSPWWGWIPVQCSNTTASFVTGIEVNFVETFGQSFILRGSKESLCINLNLATLPVDILCIAKVYWTEV